MVLRHLLEKRDARKEREKKTKPNIRAVKKRATNSASSEASNAVDSSNAKNKRDAAMNTTVTAIKRNS